MKKIGILTIIDNNNYGNRLQNFAVQENLIKEKLKCNAITLKNNSLLNNKRHFIFRLTKLILKRFLNKKHCSLRNKLFLLYNKNINFSKKSITPFTKTKREYKYFIVGSDQVWNPNFKRLSNIDLLEFADPKQKIAFSASFGINELPENLKEYVAENLKTFKAISVREEAGKKIVEELTGRTDVEVLVDPTMLLTAEEWDKVSKRPKQLDLLKTEKYILNYFLGELPEEWNNEINRIAKENDCEVINILDKKSPFYQTGPSEFLYLEKNAFMVCTDSFHSSVFSIIYDTPFVVFNRQQKGLVSMNSRIDTLLSKFKLEDRRYNGKITEKLLKFDYTEAKKILEKEKEKSINFLKKALEIED